MSKRKYLALAALSFNRSVGSAGTRIEVDSIRGSEWVTIRVKYNDCASEKIEIKSFDKFRSLLGALCDLMDDVKEGARDD